MQKQKVKLVFRKSGVFHLWHIVSSVVQRQNVVNFHNLSVARPRYEIYVIKISVSPEKKENGFLQTFPKS